MHSLRATAATNALSHNADIAKVQEWLGYANIATTRLYDQRNHRPEDSPTFRVAYETGHGGYTAIGRQRPSGGVGFTIRAPNHTPPRRTRSRFPTGRVAPG